jgi:hypothetical protein
MKSRIPLSLNTLATSLSAPSSKPVYLTIKWPRPEEEEARDATQVNNGVHEAVSFSDGSSKRPGV